MSAIQDQIRAAALAQGVDPAIALAVAQQESGFNQAARGTSGEIGIFQLMPGTATGLGVNPYDQAQNIQGGISFLASLYKQFGDWTKALVGYNAGPAAVIGGTAPSASLAYARSVLGKSAAYGTTPDVNLPPAQGSDSYYSGGVVGAGTYFGSAYTATSILGDLGQIPTWVWLGLVASIGILVVVKNRD